MSEEKTSLDEIVLEAARKALPEAEVQAIKELIFKNEKLEAQAKQDEQTISDRDHHIKSLKREIDDLNERTQTMEELQKRETEVTTREAAVKESEMTQQLRDLEVTHAKDSVALVKEMYQVPFQNRTLRESVLVNKHGHSSTDENKDIVEPGNSYPVGKSNDNSHHNYNHNEDTTTTREET